MRFFNVFFLLVSLHVFCQPETVVEQVPLSGQAQLDLDFAFASSISFIPWEKNEVLVEVMLEINDGKDNDLFELSSRQTKETLYLEMDENRWKKMSGKSDGRSDCNVSSEIFYKVFLPKGLRIRATTISGDYEFAYFGAEMKLKTISGAIDVTVPEGLGFEFKAETISGEVYSDLEITFPNGKEGLRQIVGQRINGRVNEGGALSSFETISGNIYLRKG